MQDCDNYDKNGIYEIKCISNILLMTQNIIYDYNNYSSKSERIAKYIGINREVERSLNFLFKDGIDVAYDKLKLFYNYESKYGNGSDHMEALYLFRDKNSVKIFSEILKDMFYNKKISKLTYIYSLKYLINDYDMLVSTILKTICEHNDVISEYDESYIRRSIPFNNKIDLQKYYRYALAKGYLPDVRLDDVKFISNNSLFTRIGINTLIESEDISKLSNDGIASVLELFEYGEGAAIEKVFEQFEACSNIGCSTPVWEGVLFSLSFFKEKSSLDKLIKYIIDEKSFSKDIIRNLQFFSTGPLTYKLYDILSSKPEDRDVDYNYLECKKDGKNCDYDYNPYSIRANLLKGYIGKN